MPSISSSSTAALHWTILRKASHQRFWRIYSEIEHVYAHARPTTWVLCSQGSKPKYFNTGHSHTQAHAHTHTHLHTPSRTFRCSCICMPFPPTLCVHRGSSPGFLEDNGTNAHHKHTHTKTNTHTHIYIQAHARIWKLYCYLTPCVHTNSLDHARTHARTHVHTPKCTCIHMHASPLPTLYVHRGLISGKS